MFDFVSSSLGAPTSNVKVGYSPRDFHWAYLLHLAWNESYSFISLSSQSLWDFVLWQSSKQYPLDAQRWQNLIPSLWSGHLDSVSPQKTIFMSSVSSSFHSGRIVVLRINVTPSFFCFWSCSGWSVAWLFCWSWFGWWFLVIALVTPWSFPRLLLLLLLVVVGGEWRFSRDYGKLHQKCCRCIFREMLLKQ